MRRMILLAAVILLSALTSQAQDTPAAEVSAGYFYLRLGLPDGVSHRGAAVFRVYRKTVRASFAVVFRFGNR